MDLLLAFLAKIQNSVLNAWMWIFDHKALALVLAVAILFLFWINVDDVTESDEL